MSPRKPWPLRTFLSLSGGRVEVRLRLAFRCLACGHTYHPGVHAHAGFVVGLGLVAILAVVGVGALVLAGRLDRSWFLATKVAAAIAVAVLAWMGARLQKRLLSPAIYTPALGREPRYGEIVVECPRCGSSRAAAAAPEQGPVTP